MGNLVFLSASIRNYGLKFKFAGDENVKNDTVNSKSKQLVVVCFMVSIYFK